MKVTPSSLGASCRQTLCSFMQWICLAQASPTLCVATPVRLQHQLERSLRTSRPSTSHSLAVCSSAYYSGELGMLVYFAAQHLQGAGAPQHDRHTRGRCVSSSAQGAAQQNLCSSRTSRGHGSGRRWDPSWHLSEAPPSRIYVIGASAMIQKSEKAQQVQKHMDLGSWIVDLLPTMGVRCLGHNMFVVHAAPRSPQVLTMLFWGSH